MSENHFNNEATCKRIRPVISGITDQGLEELEARKGMKIAREPDPWCTEATRDNIRHMPTELATTTRFV